MGLLDNETHENYYNGSDLGNYQLVSLDDIINNFIIIYTGEDKLITKARRLDVAFHAQRALAELSFDTFKSVKSQEIEVPASLTMALPHDYVNYTQLTWTDGSGIEHTIYPARKTSNPKAISQDTDGTYSGFSEIIPVPALTSTWTGAATGMSIVDITQDTSAGTMTFDGDGVFSAIYLPTLTKGKTYEVTVVLDSIEAGGRLALVNNPSDDEKKIYPNI